jgi:hypothetical protein
MWEPENPINVETAVVVISTPHHGYGHAGVRRLRLVRPLDLWIATG